MKKLTVISRDGGEYRGQPGVPGLQEPESEFCWSKTLHSTEEPHHTQTRWQLDGGPE